MFATFNQKTDFKNNLDTTMNIVGRTVCRLLNDYFDIPYRNSKGRKEWHMFTDSDMDFVQLAAFMRRFVESKNNRNSSVKNPTAPAIIFCIDELRKITVEETRRALLDSVAESQQWELESGLPTFFIVSSLDLFSMVDAWMTRSKRKMFPIPLPVLPSCAPLRDKLCEIQPRGRHGIDRATWPEYVTAMLDSAGGHARTLFDQVEQITTACKLPDPRDWPRSYTLPDRVANLGKIALALWRLCFRYDVAGRDCIELYDALTKKRGLASFVDHGVVSYTTMPGGPIRRAKSELTVRLAVSPATFFSYLDVPKGSSRANKALLSNAILVRTAVWTVEDAGAQKRCVKGMIAALAVVARAHFDLNGVNPTLGELLPGAHFFNNQLRHWRVPIRSRYNINDVNTTAADPSSMWCTDADRSNNVNRDVLARLSMLSNQKSIEGTIELLDERRRRAVGGFQMKMYGKCGPGDVCAWSDDALGFTKKHLAAAGTSSCVLLFCSGEASDCADNAAKAGLQGKNVVLVGTNACKALLSPFGASVLLQKLERLTRKSVAALSE